VTVRYTTFLLLFLWLVTGVWSGAHAVMYKRSPRSAGLWLLLSLLLPVAGPWMYWTFGINRIERRATRRLRGRERPFGISPPLVEEALHIAPSITGPLEALQRMTDRIVRRPLLAGNAIEPLHHGEQTYPRMLDAIAEARHSITLASYIFDWDDVGRKFAEALCDASRRGVQVHALLDGIGAVKSASRIGRMLIAAGARVEAFFPLRFPLGRFRVNMRNHRKILVVDGRIGFAGGINISARHMLTRNRPDRCEDLHFRITGPVVSQLQQAFAEDWYLAAGEMLEGEAFFPVLNTVGTCICRGIGSGPDEDLDIIHLVYQAALVAAQRRVIIMTPYFIPSRAMLTAMILAALRGVDIRLVLPSFVDLRYMRWAADAFLWELLQRGVRVYRRPPPFVHTKLMLVDDRWMMLGSANLDTRSFRLNFEFNVEAYDTTLCRRLREWTDALLPTCLEVRLEDVDARPPLIRLRDGAVKMFAPYL
jgi:cardiolipin synthase